jgi:hypothetical protein
MLFFCCWRAVEKGVIKFDLNGHPLNYYDASTGARVSHVPRESCFILCYFPYRTVSPPSETMKRTRLALLIVARTSTNNGFGLYDAPTFSESDLPFFTIQDDPPAVVQMSDWACCPS